MRLVVGERACRERAAQYRTRVEVRPKGPLIRLSRAERRMPVHHMLYKIVVPAQEGRAHPEPNIVARVGTRTTRAEARVDVEALRIFMNRRQTLGPSQDLGRNIGTKARRGIRMNGYEVGA